MPKMPRKPRVTLPPQRGPVPPLVRRKNEPVMVDREDLGVRIRTLTQDMVTEEIAEWLTDPAVMEGLNSPRTEMGLDAFRAYVAHFDNFARNLMVILEGPKETPRGLIFLDIDPRHRTGSIHTIIGEEDSRGKGIAPRGAILACHHAFLDRKLEKITFQPLERNTQAIAICEASGLKHEGTFRSHRIDGRTGERLDQRVYGLLRSEYDKAMAAFTTRVPNTED